MNKLYFIITIVFIMACGGNYKSPNQLLVKSFPKEETINGEFIKLDSASLMVKQILIVDTLLIMVNLNFNNYESFFNVYNIKNNYKFLGAFGKQGHGPLEFNSPKLTGQYQVELDGIKIWVIDLGVKVKLINLSKTLLTNNIIIEKSIKVERKIGEPIDFFVISESYVIGRSYNESGRLFFYDLNSDEPLWTPFFPITHKPKMEMYNLYTGDVKISPNLQYIVYPLSYFKELDVFSQKGENLFSIVFNEKTIHPDFSSTRNSPIPKNLESFYTSTFLTDSCIYVLNSNCNIGDAMSGNNKQACKMEVFNYSGRALCNYNLDKRVGQIAIDEKNGFLYGTTPFSMSGNDKSNTIESLSSEEGGLIRFKIE